MSTMAAALRASGLKPSADLADQLEIAAQPTGREVAPGVVFKSNFSIDALLDGIIGDADCRIYIIVNEPAVSGRDRDHQMLKFVQDYITSHPELGSTDASVRDIDRVEFHTDHLDLSRRWVGIHCRNATIAWEVTAAMRSISNWPCAVGKITCPKVEQVLRREGISAESLF